MATETSPVLVRPLGRWSLVAILHHHPGRPTAVEVVHGAAEIDVEAWSRSEGWCEHCRTRRARTTTYLLRDAQGRLAQVGASCLADFAGHPRPLDALGHARPRRSAHRALRRRRAGGADQPVEYIDTRAYLAQVAQAIFDTGFVGAAAATRERPATWVQAAMALDRGHPPSDRADKRARQVLAWAREELGPRKFLADFQRRLAVVLSQDRLTRRELATAAAAVHSFHAELRRRIAAREKAGDYIGRPGEPTAVTFRLRRVSRVATLAGPKNRHVFYDELGRCAIWDSDERSLAPGRHRLRVTVARHVRVEARRLTILASCESMNDAV